MPSPSSRFWILSSIVVFGFLFLSTLVSALTDNQHYHHDYNYKINHLDICLSNVEDINLLIMVHTAGRNVNLRLAVRHTWGSLVKRKDVRLLFLLGSPAEKEIQQNILEEDRIYGDILQEDFLDNYKNLTLKTIMMVKWVSANCPNARFLLKIDDDVFMNPDSLLSFLGHQNVSEASIFGRVWRSVAPYRDKGNKYYLSKDDYPELKFPDFASGPSYVLTQKAVPLLYAMALETKPIHLEDVFLNGICAEKAKIPRIHKPGLFLPSSEVKSVKNIRKDVLTSHDFPSHHLRLLWWLLYDSRQGQLDYVLSSRGQKTLAFINETRTLTTTLTNGAN